VNVGIFQFCTHGRFGFSDNDVNDCEHCEAKIILLVNTVILLAIETMMICFMAIYDKCAGIDILRPRS
jgi:hypothetical protein